MHQDKSKEDQVQELQLFEHTLQNILIEKQSMQAHMNEIINALNEINRTSGEVYRVIGDIMLSADKSNLKKELHEKKDILNMRINSLEKQEQRIDEKINAVRSEIALYDKQK